MNGSMNQTSFLRVYHHTESLYFLRCEQTVDYFGEGKIRKCGISNADAERQVA